jgi:hypothetical protein
MASITFLLLQFVFLLTLCTGQELIASLDYGTFQGAYSQKYNITYFQKIPFAAPPVGENRFRAPQPPLPITNGTYDSTQPFDMCPQRTVHSLPPLPTISNSLPGQRFRRLPLPRPLFPSCKEPISLFQITSSHTHWSRTCFMPRALSPIPLRNMLLTR